MALAPIATSQKTYQNLRTQIQKLIGATEQKILADINHEKVQMAWKIGKILEEHLLQNSRASYGDQLFDQLEKDILISKRTLYQMRNFYKTYPKIPAREKRLNWSHYQNLLVVKSDERRKYLEDFTQENDLSSRQLKEKIAQNKQRKQKRLPPKNVNLKFSRGVLFTYKTARLADSNQLVIDCGFNIFTPNPDKKFKQAGLIVESKKRGEKFLLEKSKLDSKRLHTYKAVVEKVIDGDTLKVVLDLGFGIKHREIIRLAKIDAPEIATLEGKKSFEALKKILKNAPFLILKTNKTDIYGRFVADVFLAKKGETNPQNAADAGSYLNQMLLDLGAVEVW